MAKFAKEIKGMPGNVCAMTTLTSGERSNLRRLDQLRRVNAKCRGLSIEPLWERIPPEDLDLNGIDWVIVGGGAGSKAHARDFPIEWAVELKEHCQNQGVAFFMKQMGCNPTWKGERVSLNDSHGGDWDEWADEWDLNVREFPQYFKDYRAAEMILESTPRRSKSKSALSVSDVADFAKLDAVVTKFAKGYVEAGLALYQIRKRKLYRDQFKTFEGYCQSIHQISRQYANKLIKAGKVTTELETIVSNAGISLPKNEAQVRELARVPDAEDRGEVYCDALESVDGDEKRLTAKVIKSFVDQKIPPQVVPSVIPSSSDRLKSARDIIEQLEFQHADGGDITDLIEQLKSIVGGLDAS